MKTQLYSTEKALAQVLSVAALSYSRVAEEKKILERLTRGSKYYSRGEALAVLENFLVEQQKGSGFTSAFFVSKYSTTALWNRLFTIAGMLEEAPSAIVRAEYAAIINCLYKRLNSAERKLRKLLSSIKSALKKLTYCFDLRLILRTKIVDRFKYLSDFSGSEEADAITLLQPVYQFTFNSLNYDTNRCPNNRSIRHSYC